MKLFQVVLAVVLVVVGLVAVATVHGCHQEQVPINPVPGWPCGTGAWFECPSGGCCFRGEECSKLGGCRYVGESPTWGASPEGGTERLRLTPEQARKAAPR